MSEAVVTRRQSLQTTIGAALAAGTGPAHAQPASLKAILNAGRTGAPITRMMFGALIEHIGNLINYSLWSEVLDDRKFFYVVDNQPVPTSGRASGRKWNPIGPETSVRMDGAAPYVGTHSPMVTLAGGELRGLKQAGLSLVKGKGYSGRIVIAGDAGARVTVTLIWGPAAADRQSVDVPLATTWKTVPLRFTSGADTTAAQIEIAGTGTGTFRVGAVSLMPDDNLQGFRPDTIALLKQLDSGFYRVPGGNFVSGHDWRTAIGDPDKRPTVMDPAWHAPQPNDVGTDELVHLCRLLGVEPYMCVNTGFGDAVHDGAELVEYCNGSAATPMGRLRAANGHPEPHRIRYWNIGNEMYGPWQMGFMPPEHYMIKHNRFAAAMRAVDPTITLIGIGAMPDEMTIDQCFYYIDPHTRQVVGKPPKVEFGSPNDWTYRLIKECTGNFDLISEHCYGDAHRYDFAQAKILPQDVDEPAVESCRRAPNRIRLKREYWEQYKETFPSLKDGKIKISVDEWGFRNARGLKQTLGLAMTLHELFRNTDFFTMAAFTMGMSWIDYNRTACTYSNAGLLFRMYQNFGTHPVEVEGNSPQPLPKWPVGGDQPRINAGSPTYPLDIAAALTADRKSLTLGIVNATETEQPLLLNIRDIKVRSSGKRWRLTGPSLAAANHVGQPPQVTVSEQPVSFAGRIAAAPYSIELYNLPLA
jgi:alpha-N-arabinofuranosidase